MPKDVSSSSSSEDEAENVAMETAAPRKETAKKTVRFECPEDFMSFCHVPCSSTLADNLRNHQNELWLIKAPASFDPQCFSGVEVPLAGLQTVKVPAGSDAGPAQQIYSVLASPGCSPDLRLLTSDSQTASGHAFAPAFSGLLNICESYGDGSANRIPHIIPAAPAPSVPPGLRQRFHPFGCKIPTLTCVAENEADGGAFGPSSTTLRPLVAKQFIEDEGVVDDNDEEEGRKRKKKKKKEKRLKSEQMEVLLKMKREPSEELPDEAATALPLQREEQQGDRKKKKKRAREREEVEEGLEPSVRIKVEPDAVKCEPVDILYGDAAESSGKKKKKKKKSKAEED